MATPTRSHVVSTPKSHLPSTPNRPVASPRPGSSAVAQKSLAYKSPAVKTPASAHGHAHTVSVSSQPSSTPLAAAAIHDELLALNSPAAALINSIAPTGLTPITSGQDGLGISTRGQPGLAASRDGHAHTDPESQRLARLQQAMANLKSKAVGRGITRESVERVARLQGFEALWDEDNLTIAGNIVAIEISFDPVFKNTITDLALTLNSADGESHPQSEATDVLKQELLAFTSSAPEDLEFFSRNINYLAQMDRIDVAPNAFEIVRSLYGSLRSIWDEEKNRMSWRTSLQHARKGATGSAHFDRKPRLGLCIDYWNNSSDANLDSDQQDDMSGVAHLQATVACAAGAPGVSASRTWLTPSVLVETSETENVLNGDTQNLVVDWKEETAEPEPDLAKEQKGRASDAKTIALTLDVHFSCELEPQVLLPHNVALNLNNQHCPLIIDQTKAMTFQTALQKARNTAFLTKNPDTIESRWSRRVPCLGKDGQVRFAAHSYALYSASQNAELWVIPISRLTFSHPKQLASALSVFRLYARVWTLLKTLIIHPVAKPELAPAPDSTSLLIRAPKVKKRSNQNKAVQLVNGASVSERRDESAVPVDISLDFLSDPSKCKIDVFAPLPARLSGSTDRGFLHISSNIGPNGSIEINDLSGVSSSDTSALKLKVARMVESTEDIGIVLQWLLERRE